MVNIPGGGNSEFKTQKGRVEGKPAELTDTHSDWKAAWHLFSSVYSGISLSHLKGFYSSSRPPQQGLPSRKGWVEQAYFCQAFETGGEQAKACGSSAWEGQGWRSWAGLGDQLVLGFEAAAGLAVGVGFGGARLRRQGWG